MLEVCVYSILVYTYVYLCVYVVRGWGGGDTLYGEGCPKNYMRWYLYSKPINHQLKLMEENCQGLFQF